MNDLEFTIVKKDRLFYDQFEYCLGFYLEEVNCLRVLDHDHIENLIERRQHWQEIAQQRWLNGRQRHGIILTRRWKNITEKTKTDLHTLAKHLLATPCNFKLVVTVNQGYIYTNEPNLIDELDRMPELTCKTYSRAQISRPKNTVKLKKSLHQYRSYFKHLTLTAEQKDHVMDFLYAQRNQVRVSPALQRWLDQPFNRTQDHYFVDHHSESWLTMLALVQPGLVRKTMKIITDK